MPASASRLTRTLGLEFKQEWYVSEPLSNARRKLLVRMESILGNECYNGRFRTTAQVAYGNRMEERFAIH